MVDVDPDEFWLYWRTCLHCGVRWPGLHCPHDGYQNPCPNCDRLPVSLPPPIKNWDCQCEFDANWNAS